MPYVWAGAFICKGKLIKKCDDWMQSHISLRWQNTVLMLSWVNIFFLTNILHKAVLVGIVAILSFLIFNLLNKPKPVKKVLLFLGEHSTNIWLTHMFFYAYLFKGLVVIARYPLLILLFMISLCLVTSYIVMGIEKVLYKSLNRINLI